MSDGRVIIIRSTGLRGPGPVVHRSSRRRRSGDTHTCRFRRPVPSQTARTVLWVATRGYRRANCLDKDGFLSPMRALDTRNWKAADVNLSGFALWTGNLDSMSEIQLSQLDTARRDGVSTLFSLLSFVEGGRALAGGKPTALATALDCISVEISG